MSFLQTNRNVLSIFIFITGLILFSWIIFMSGESFLLTMAGKGTKSIPMKVVSRAGLPPANSNDKNTHTTRSGAKCLTFEDTFDKLIALVSQSPSPANAVPMPSPYRDQIIVAMPPKGGGQAAQGFIHQCANKNNLFHPNYINNPDPHFQADFVKDLTIPSLVANHLFNDIAAIRLFNNMAPNSLFLYLHRDEDDRLISATRHVVETRICEHKTLLKGEDVSNEGNRCVVKEEALTNLLKAKESEIGHGARTILTCDFYDALYETSAHVVFMHYKQLDKLQNVLAKYYCPELVSAKRIHSNTSAEKNVLAFVKLESDGREIALNDWLGAKRGLLSFAFDLKEGHTCKRKTNIMQQDLLSCEDELLQVTLDTSFN